MLYKSKHEFGIFKTNVANKKEIKIHEINGVQNEMNCWQNCELNKKLTEHDKAI